VINPHAVTKLRNLEIRKKSNIEVVVEILLVKDDQVLKL
jgi:hypothetical protein